jgi:hypothetical protein
MTAHSRFAPSAMERIVQCPGSVKMQAGLPDDAGPAAQEGTAAHWVLEQTLHGVVPETLVGTAAPNGVPVDEEMAVAAGSAAAFVEGLGLPSVSIESQVAIPRIHPDCYGTPDVRGWRQAGRELHVMDFKYGFGPVEAFENLQLAAYAAGAISAAGLDGQDELTCVVHMHILQPRPYHRLGPIRTWSTTAAKLRPLWNVMQFACARADQPEPPLSVGPECLNCRARHRCPKLQRAALGLLDRVGQGEPLDLPPAAAGLELTRLQAGAQQLQARISGLETQVMHSLKSGHPVPGWATEPARTREAWTGPPAEIKALADLLGIAVTKEVFLTPKQARDAGAPKEFTERYAARPPGSLKLVPDDGSNARQAFTITN